LPAQLAALRPRTTFAYLSAPLPIRNFADTEERIAKGHGAYDAGVRAGWQRLETSRQDYRIMPRAFEENSVAFFGDMRRRFV
jgi:hypothetical protein